MIIEKYGDFCYVECSVSKYYVKCNKMTYFEHCKDGYVTVISRPLNQEVVLIVQE